jgi:hypothetical protein
MHANRCVFEVIVRSEFQNLDFGIQISGLWLYARRFYMHMANGLGMCMIEYGLGMYTVSQVARP